MDADHAGANARAAVLHVLCDGGLALCTMRPKDYIAKYKGKFDQGWDKVREETLKRQIDMGVVPAGTKLTSMPPGVQAWDKLSDDEKKVYARQMECFAGFGEHTDDEVGRLVTSLEEMGELDNTLFFYIAERQVQLHRRHRRIEQCSDKFPEFGVCPTRSL